MLDSLAGRPDFAWRRRETYAVLVFALWILLSGRRRGPRLLWIRNLNRSLQRFQPWQIMGGTLTLLYALRHTDKILGLNAPDNLPGYLYAREYNRATWIVTGLDAGFATAASIKSKWLRDLSSMVFSVYYFLHHDEADNKIARFREVCSLDLLRVTWDKLNNPYLHFFTMLLRPSLQIRRQITILRPDSSTYTRPISCWLYFAGTEAELAQATELVLDFPGGGFVAMGPTHHEDRLRQWARRLRKPVVSVDYGKAPEYPYPYAIDEGFDCYNAIIKSCGRVIGMMSGQNLKIILSGDSAGGNIAVNVVLKIVQAARATPSTIIPRPVGLALTYGALNFSFSSWAWPSSSPYPANFVDQVSDSKNFVEPHIGPIRALSDSSKASIGQVKESLGDTKSTVHQHANIGLFARQQHDQKTKQQTKAMEEGKIKEEPTSPPSSSSSLSNDDNWSGIKLRRRSNSFSHSSERPVFDNKTGLPDNLVRKLSSGSGFAVDGPVSSLDPKLIRRHSRSNSFGVLQSKYAAAQLKTSPIDVKLPEAQMAPEPRLTLASKTGYLNDRIISPSMMWTMCLLYLGARYRPGVENDYHLSPILAPAHLLQDFPPLFLQCGGRDPLVDDTVMFGGRVREAKREKKERKKKAATARRGRKASVAAIGKYSMKWANDGKGPWMAGQTLPDVKGIAMSTSSSTSSLTKVARNNSMIAPLTTIDAGRESGFPPRMSSSKSTPNPGSRSRGATFTSSPRSVIDLDRRDFDYGDYVDDDEEDEDEDERKSNTSDENVAPNSNDGVTMQIFPGWSHGYLQMSTIMPEAKAAIDDISDWMDSAFDRHRVRTKDVQREPVRLKRTNSFYC